MKELEELLYFWGYAKETDNQFGFFDYEGKASTSSKAQFEGFKTMNEKTMSWVLSKKFNPHTQSFIINKDREGYRMLAEKKNIFGLADV